jgi:DNA polymerase III subunit epsilon
VASTSSPTSSARLQAITTAKNALELAPLFLDTETTGLDSNAEIIEIVILESDGTHLFQSLVKPRTPIPTSATQINGITNAMVEKSPRWVTLWEQIRGIFFNRTIAIYNADFDLKMIDQTNRAYGLSHWQPGKPVVDVMTIFADFRSIWDPYRSSYKFFRLEEAGKYLNIPIPNSHRATEDTLLAREVLLKMAAAE